MSHFLLNVHSTTLILHLRAVPTATAEGLTMLMHVLISQGSSFREDQIFWLGINMISLNMSR